jgi:putative dimethyl sulfoxide reductase chaperone
MQNQEKASEALSRSNLYGLLSRVTHSEVDAPLLAEFRRPEVAEALSEAGADISLALASVDDKALLEELAVSYTQLFLMGVNPHGSVQRGEGRLWGDSTVAANQFMEEAGLAVEGKSSLLPDHISLELAVMQQLTAEQAAALAAGDTQRAGECQALQGHYLKEHLGAWGPTFFARATEQAGHEFYRVLCRLGQAFLHSERVAHGL